ncbi:hypothetical protein HYW67_02595 [Candidatus Parcubacteria bacterium]|nr:hypothetical protein [Candidatus Parcubacteria bacterium]
MRSAAILKGVVATVGLLILYFAVTTVISGWEFAVLQFGARWYWILGLAVGFGVQVGLFTCLRALHVARVSRSVVAVSGTMSSAAMLACCAHYLVNVVPLIGISGAAAVIGQYQTELFAFGAVANVVGIGYFLNKLIRERVSYGINAAR